MHGVGDRRNDGNDDSFSPPLSLPANLPCPSAPYGRFGFDRQYSDTLGLLHEDAYEDSEPLTLPGVDANVVEVRVLTAVDLAVSKIGRFSSQDRHDIESLARRGLIDATSLRRRAEEALAGYVDDTARVQGSIELACRIVADAGNRSSRGRSK